MLSPPPVRRRARAPQRGLSIVEMMIGVTIGLIVVAAASLVVATQLTENRKLLLETQLQQDLRAAADIITRELRRSGAWSSAQAAVWSGSTPALPNVFAAVTPASGAAAAVGYAYSRFAGDTGGPYGFKLEGGVLKTRLAASGWQELTDGNVMEVTGFTVTADSGPPSQIPCPRECSGGGTACWPTITVRKLTVAITGRAVSDHSVVRSISTTVRLRNDLVGFNDAAHPAQFCPS